MNLSCGRWVAINTVIFAATSSRVAVRRFICEAGRRQFRTVAGDEIFPVLAEGLEVPGGFRAKAQPRFQGVLCNLGVGAGLLIALVGTLLGARQNGMSFEDWSCSPCAIE